VRAYYRGGVRILSPVTNFMNGMNEDDYWAGDDYVSPSKYGREVKTCRRCDRKVEMSSDHGTCDSCASEMERGVEY
jgi:hypothetical protein